ncbi:MAG: DUF547 domain-containing protein [Pseudomonadota bacterium]|nr:DUF547 domain-containing protein [Pseudomonadota bacterium]
MTGHYISDFVSTFVSMFVSRCAKLCSSIALLCCALLLAPTSLIAEEPKATSADALHASWDQLLSKHVKEHTRADGAKQLIVASAVDYAGFFNDRKQLQAYIDQLQALSYEQYQTWSSAKQLAFLINAYNALTVELVLSEYPNISSIKELGSLFQSPWQRDVFMLFGENVSLDDIEHGWIRGASAKHSGFKEPLIHFAVNCASLGCPALRAEAYTEEKLEQQLQSQARGFMSDTSRNYVQGQRVYLSKIFDWYEEDFEQGWRGYSGLDDVIMAFSEELKLTPEQLKALKQGKLSIRFTDYDWGLNSQ